MANDIQPDDHLKIQAELERKYVDAMMDALARFEKKNISLEAFEMAFLSIYETVSGLVDWDTLNPIVSDFHEMIEKEKRSCL